ncbi:MAG: HD domain-containing protein [Treponema sp.]|jgi:hypothetical protein|nr:HD domain-containing protein [Treponema sp.]
MRIGEVIREMIYFFGDGKKYAAHALKVFAYAQALADLEKLGGRETEVLLYAALLHDTGIKIAREKYGSCDDRQQEEEGPPAAAQILSRLGMGEDIIGRARFLIARHHSPDASEDLDFRVLLEADYLVNLEEGNLPLSMKDEILERHFRTESGKTLLRTLFP